MDDEQRQPVKRMIGWRNGKLLLAVVAVIAIPLLIGLGVWGLWTSSTKSEQRTVDRANAAYDLSVAALSESLGAPTETSHSHPYPEGSDSDYCTRHVLWDVEPEEVEASFDRIEAIARRAGSGYVSPGKNDAEESGEARTHIGVYNGYRALISGGIPGWRLPPHCVQIILLGDKDRIAATATATDSCVYCLNRHAPALHQKTSLGSCDSVGGRRPFRLLCLFQECSDGRHNPGRSSFLSRPE